MRKKVKFLLAVLGALLLTGCSNKANNFPEASPIQLKTNQEKGEKMTENKKVLPQPKMEIDTKKKYSAVLKTSAGDIVIDLFADKTPITVNNFVYLTQKHFYDQTIFHRVIKGFMIQGGDPNGDGTGGPGYRFADEPFEGEYKRGVVAMANAGPNTNGSQFFIMHQDYPLPKNYVIFGQVVKGMETVDKIAQAPVEPGPGGENSRPVNPVVVESVVILTSENDVEQ